VKKIAFGRTWGLFWADFLYLMVCDLCLLLTLKQCIMNYYFSKILKGNFNDTVEKVIAALKTEQFGVLTEIDIKDTLKKKLDVNFNNYKILGACNPPYAHKALLAENKIGTMLPCNVIVQELDSGDIEVAAVNPMASMQAVENDALKGIAEEITMKLKAVIEGL